MTQGISNDALLSSACAGDREAMDRLLAVSRPAIRRMALSQCSSVDDADEAVQETLWLVYRRIGTLRTIAAFPGWLFAIVRRECWRLSRRFGRSVELPAELPDAGGEEDLDLRQDLAKAIAALPPKYRQVLILRDVEQHSTHEVAVALKLTHEAVKSRLHRARALVKRRLAH